MKQVINISDVSTRKWFAEKGINDVGLKLSQCHCIGRN